MPRSATTSDVFNAVAERRRREILRYLAFQASPVGEIVANFGLSQSSVSKHLHVLREVGLVGKRRDGRNALYWTNVDAMVPFLDWIKWFTPHGTS